MTDDKLPLGNKVEPLKHEEQWLLTLYDEEWKNIEKLAFNENLKKKAVVANSSQNHETENEDSADDENNNNCDCLEDNDGVKLHSY